MPTHFLIKSQPESALLVSSNTTVSNDVGICYFDPIDETLKELTALDNHVLTVQPIKKSVKKYYLVLDPSVTAPTTISITPVFPDDPVEGPDNYAIKVIISATEPTQSQFDDEVNMNTHTITNPADGAIIPIWVLVHSKALKNKIYNIAFELEYE